MIQPWFSWGFWDVFDGDVKIRFSRDNPSIKLLFWFLPDFHIYNHQSDGIFSWASDLIEINELINDNSTIIFFPYAPCLLHKSHQIFYHYHIPIYTNFFHSTINYTNMRTMVLLYLPIPAAWSIWDRDFHGILVVAPVRGNQALDVSFGASVPCFCWMLMRF